MTAPCSTAVSFWSESSSSVQSDMRFLPLLLFTQEIPLLATPRTLWLQPCELRINGTAVPAGLEGLQEWVFPFCSVPHLTKWMLVCTERYLAQGISLPPSSSLGYPHNELNLKQTRQGTRPQPAALSALQELTRRRYRKHTPYSISSLTSANSINPFIFEES